MAILSTNFLVPPLNTALAFFPQVNDLARAGSPSTWKFDVPRISNKFSSA